jgi:UDP-N-acetylglucosamine acyltransferase
MNFIHPTAILTGDVSFGTGNTVGPYAVITGPVTVGDDNWIGAGVVIGAPPEVRSFVHPPGFVDRSGGTGISIGDRNVLREYAQIHQGWKSTTRLGSGIFLMNQVYVAHDCHIGDDVTLAGSVLLAGHTQIGARANLGLGASVHQGTMIGAGSMVGMGAVVTREVPPFGKAFGNPARLRGINSIGMERSGISAGAIEAVRDAYSTGSPTAADFERLASMPELNEFVGPWAKRDRG